jgi:hypothetical protein
MSDRHAYTYTVLRYVHDVMTGEFVNVGVVLHCSSSGFVKAKMRTTYGRLAAVFPDIDGPALRRMIIGLANGIDRLAREDAKAGLLKSRGDAATFARAVLPDDDSSLRWSPVGSGIARDPNAALDRLFDRMVTRYDEKPKARRPDDEIWRPVREILRERKISLPLEEKTIRSPLDEVEFKHAWKNGVWHCYEPLSFDLAQADGIRDKAHRWAGRLLGVQDAEEEFRPYFIVGRPQDPKLEEAFDTAVDLLRMSPHRPEVFLEEDANDLVDRIEDEVRLHRR